MALEIQRKRAGGMDDDFDSADDDSDSNDENIINNMATQSPPRRLAPLDAPGRSGSGSGAPQLPR